MAESPLVEEALDEWLDPERVFIELFGSSDTAFWLDAGIDAVDGWSFIGDIGDGVVAVGNPRADRVRIERPATGEEWTVDGSLIELIGTFAASRPNAESSNRPGFQRGWVGWIGYETGAAALGLPIARDSMADSAMIFTDRMIAFDHQRRVMWLLASSTHDPDIVLRTHWISEIRNRLQSLRIGIHYPAPERAGPILRATALHSRDTYLGLIESCQERIREGDAYQLCLTNRFDVETSEDPLQIYLRLRRGNPTPHGGFITNGDVSVLSSSPETFLTIDTDGTVRTRPIKGTRRRGSDSHEDQKLRDELRHDPKELAENLMIVDLMRNDLSRISTVGSVTVEDLFAVETYRNVFQLVSTVSATKAPHLRARDVLLATFPAGSMTGAPKSSAMRILCELEASPRGPYAGAFGYFDVDGSVELSMTIRTIVMSHGKAVVGAGGGITALSDPEFEYEESTLKAAPLVAALGAALPRGESSIVV